MRTFKMFSFASAFVFLSACAIYVRPDLYPGSGSVRNTQEVFASASVSGCSAEEVSNMQIAPRAVGTYAITSYVMVRVTNLSSDFVNIEDEAGPIVVRLCPRGSISLFRARNLFWDGSYYNYQYIAKGTLPDGGMGFDRSPIYTLTKYDISNGRGQQFYTWEIRLRRWFQ